MHTASEIPIVHMPPLEDETSSRPDISSIAVGPWSPVEVPRGRRPSPTTIAVVAALAGIGAMALGGAAVLSAARSHERTTTVVAPRAPAAAARAERAALALLAKPSTERVVFRRAGGRLLLAVGSGGRAAILVRGFERARPGAAYYAWALRPGARPVRAARFLGTERAVFLSVPLGPRTSVAVVAAPPGGASPAHARIVAVRG
jgi:hypothetical protein